MSIHQKPIHVPTERESLQEHTDIDLFCFDITCSCHENQEHIQEIADQIADGLMTAAEADHYYHGSTI